MRAEKLVSQLLLLIIREEAQPLWFEEMGVGPRNTCIWVRMLRGWSQGDVPLIEIKIQVRLKLLLKGATVRGERVFFLWHQSASLYEGDLQRRSDGLQAEKSFFR
jgi:hypothetical protein